MSTTITGDAPALSLLAQAGICELSVATRDSHSVQAVFLGRARVERGDLPDEQDHVGETYLPIRKQRSVARIRNEFPVAPSEAHRSSRVSRIGSDRELVCR